MKKLLIICSLLFMGCYNKTPAKILKHPSLYGVPIVLDTKWDGNHPVQNWVMEVEFDTEFTDFQGRVWRLERDPSDENKVLFIVDVLK